MSCLSIHVITRTYDGSLSVLFGVENDTKNPPCLCIIDPRAAYDYIDRDMLFSVLNIRTKAPKITSLLKSLYTGTKAPIKTLLIHSSAHWLSSRRN